MLSFLQMWNTGGFLLIGFMIDKVALPYLLPFVFSWVGGGSESKLKYHVNIPIRKLSSPIIFVCLYHL